MLPVTELIFIILLFTAPTSKIRYGCYDPRKFLSYCTLTKVNRSDDNSDGDSDKATSDDV